MGALLKLENIDIFGKFLTMSKVEKRPVKATEDVGGFLGDHTTDKIGILPDEGVDTKNDK